MSEVVLKVYEISSARGNNTGQSLLKFIGLGAFHTSIEVSGREYSYSEAGITTTAPTRLTKVPNLTFREQILLGLFQGSSADISSILAEFRKQQFRGELYHLVQNNCNHFTDAMSKALLGTEIPAWINRAASIGSWFMPSNNTPKQRSTTPHTKSSSTASNERPELTEQQKQMLNKLKNGGS